MARFIGQTHEDEQNGLAERLSIRGVRLLYDMSHDAILAVTRDTVNVPSRSATF
jgi:hypothetical protein